MFHARILRYLDEVVRAGSIRKAAAALGVASSSISRQITDLEAELGTPVFERMPGKLRLTAAGELMMTHVRATLKEHERLVARIGRLQNPAAGVIRIATQNGPIGGLVPQLALDFVQRFPAVQFSTASLTGEALVAAVTAGEFDIGFGYNLPLDSRLKVIHAIAAHLGAVVHPTHPLARRVGVRLAECAEYPLLLADETMSLRKLIRDAAMRTRARLGSTLETNAIDLMKRFLADGESVCFLAEPDVVADIRAGRLVFIPLLDRSIEAQTLSLVQRENAVLEPSAALFVDEMARMLAGPQL